MNLIAVFLLCALSQDALDTHVRQLAAEDPEIRERAVARLVQLGRKALPPLRKHLESTRDADVAAHIKRIIGEIERRIRISDYCTGPRAVTISFEKTPIREAFAALAGTSSVKISVDEKAQGTVTAAFDETPLWEVMEALRKKAHISYEIKYWGNSYRIWVRPRAEREPPRAMAGPFWITLERIRTFASKPYAASEDDVTQFHFQFAAEPDDVPLAFRLRIKSLVDEKGQDYAPLLKDGRLEGSVGGRWNWYRTSDAFKRMYRALTDGITRLTLQGELVLIYPHDVRRSRVEKPTEDLPKDSSGDADGFRVQAIEQSDDRLVISITLKEGLPSRFSSNPDGRFEAITKDGKRHVSDGDRFRATPAKIRFYGIKLDQLAALEFIQADGTNEVTYPFEMKDIPLD